MIERLIEKFIFSSRWLLAPFYMGLVFALCALLIKFLQEAYHVIAIILTDLLVGILIGLGVAILFILHSNFRRPLRRIVEKHIGGEVLRIELANQVSFLNRAVLERTLNEVPRGGHVLLDATQTDYIDPGATS